MKRWYYFVLAALAVAGVVYVYMHPGFLGSLWGSSDRGQAVVRQTHMNWRTVERPFEGFNVDMPADAKGLDVPAYNEAGGSETVRMLVANPDGDTTFAVAWEDNPPVARESRTPERTLNMARDGMLARTQTTLMSESHGLQHGYLTLDVAAINGGGGVLNAHFVYAADRLYMLTATFPSVDARHDSDVKRFFESFAPSQAAAIPENIPAAAQN